MPRRTGPLVSQRASEVKHDPNPRSHSPLTHLLVQLLLITIRCLTRVLLLYQ